MRVVIDTNVIVSGLLNPYGVPAEILRIIFTGELIPLYDSMIISEYFDVLNRPKFNFNPENIEIIIKEIEAIGSLVMPVSLKNTLPDPDDNVFLEVAIAGNAKCIITGNKNHFPKKLCLGISVFSPSEFLKFFKTGK